jgi:DNA-binding transcriptional regulator YdaS (Cro superfamily)
MQLLDYLKSMPTPERATFAQRCGTTIGHLTNIAYGYRPCGESLAIAVERESGGVIQVEVLCPDVDWPVIRGKPAREAA